MTRPSVTASQPLPGAMSPCKVTDAVSAHLNDLYGSRSEAVTAIAQSHRDLAMPLSPRYPDIGAQVVFAVREELATMLDDVLRRRTLLGATADQGCDAAPAVAAIMARECGWSAAETMRQLESYVRDIRTTQVFRASEGDAM
jgi:glycerol-3-phosphate dehydrogenase